LYDLFALTSVFEGLDLVFELLCFSVDVVMAGFVPIAVALWGVFFCHGSWFKSNQLSSRLSGILRSQHAANELS
jgi:hypothetical protein